MPAKEGDFPHQVSKQIKNRRGTFGSALIIHPLLLVSAAHLFEGPETRPPNIWVVAGKSDLTKSDPAGQFWDVVRVFKHKKYNSLTWDSDIVILVLNQPLTFNEVVRPIQLLDSDLNLPGTNCSQLLRSFGLFRNPTTFQN